MNTQVYSFSKVSTTKETSLVGSSETTRKTPRINKNSFLQSKKETPLFLDIYSKPFNFDNLKHFRPQHVKSYSPEFLSWLIGFTEGDGSFIIDKTNKRLFFTITQQDVVLLRRIRKQLGFGSICNDTKYPEIKRLHVTDRSQIKVLIHLFNGNLLLKKTTQRFTKWVDFYNHLTGENIQSSPRWTDFTKPDFDWTKNRIQLHQSQIEQLRVESVVWNSSWLTGFIEAEGCFNAGQRIKHVYDKHKTTEMRFLLSQTNELEILSHVRQLLGDVGSIWTPKKKDDKIHYCYQVSSLCILQTLINYISRYKIHGKKNFVYVRWTKIYNILEEIRVKKANKTYTRSLKQEQRLNRLIQSIRKDNLKQETMKKLKLEVEDRVPL